MGLSSLFLLLLVSPLLFSYPHQAALTPPGRNREEGEKGRAGKIGLDLMLDANSRAPLGYVPFENGSRPVLALDPLSPWGTGLHLTLLLGEVEVVPSAVSPLFPLPHQPNLDLLL